MWLAGLPVESTTPRLPIDGIGLSGHDARSAKETADPRILSAQTTRAALVLYRPTNARPQPWAG
jgi:hypothetical protein